MSIAVVQHHAEIKGNNVPGSSNQITLGSALTPGNLLVVCIGVNISVTGYTVNTAAGWHVLETGIQNEIGDGSIANMVLGRYVQSGDSNTTIPAVWTAGGTWWAYSIYEVSGVSGDLSVDLMAGFTIRPDEAGNGIYPLPILVNGSLALTWAESYDGSSTATMTGGSWTVDDNIVNNSNFGSMAGASRSVNAGDVLGGVWSGLTSGPQGYCGIILSPGPVTKIFPRHVQRFGGHNSAFPLAMGWEPVPGNLLVTYLFCQRGDQDYLFDTGWTVAHATGNGGGITASALQLAYRYVASGDVRSYSYVTSGGNLFYGGFAVELSGVTGVFSTDLAVHAGSAFLNASTHNPIIVTSLSTTTPNQLALIAWGNYDSSGAQQVSSGWGLLGASGGASEYGDTELMFQYAASPGTNLTAVLSATENDVGTWMHDIWGGGVSSGGGGGPMAVNRLFPVGLNVRAFPLDSSRFFPRA